MSGPCTDCGGPDYQTLVAHIAELETENRQLEEDRLLDMDQGYYRNLEARIVESEADLRSDVGFREAAEQGAAENRARAERAEAERDEWQRKYELERGHVLRGPTNEEWVRRDLAEESITKAEAALAERDRMLRLAWFWHDRSPQHETFDAFLADLRARAEEGSE